MINDEAKIRIIKNNPVEELCSLSKEMKTYEFVDFLDDVSIPKVNRKKIKTIGLICNCLYNGGVEKVVSQLLFIFREMNYNLCLLTSEEANEFDYDYPSDVMRFVIPKADNISSRLQRIADIVNKNNIDILINNSWTEDSSFWECILMKYLNVYYVQYTHGALSSMYISLDENEIAYHKEYKYYDVVLSLSKTSALFYQMCGCRSYLIKNPISNDLLNINYDYTNNPYELLWVGRVTKDKGIIDALRILGIVKEKIPNVVLKIVGKCENKELETEINEVIKDLSINKNVFFEGYHSDVDEYYKKAKLLISTSNSEGYPMSLIESTMYHLPFAMYSLPYLAIVEDRKGFVEAKQGDVGSMAKVIIELLENDKLYRKIKDEIIKKAIELKKYDIKKAWKDIFDICLNKKECFCNYSDDMSSIMMIDSLINTSAKIACRYKNQNSIKERIINKAKYISKKIANKNQ